MGCGRLGCAAALLAPALLVWDSASGAGFQIREDSVESLGRAFAGTVAVQHDLAVIANNPAAMVALDGSGTLVALTVLDADSTFDGGGVDASGRPLAGGDGGDPGDPAAVPATFYAAPAIGQWRWGVSLTAPFGLATEYDEDWVGRYEALESGMKTINAGLAVAYDFDDRFALGGALSVQFADALLSCAVDFGASLAARGAPGFAPQSADGRAKIRGDDFGFGWTLGALWRATPDTDIGLSFKSAIDQTLEGDADFTVPTSVAAVLAATGSTAFVDTGFEAELDTPWVATLGFSHRFGKFMLAADASRTGWSRFNRILVEYDNPAQPATLLRQEWRDSWYLALGGDWQVSKQWTVRAGTAWDETPTVDEFRSPRVPDSDRTWLALGASYTAPSEHWRVDLGYAHLFADDTPIDRTSATGSTLTGESSFAADVLGTSLLYRF